MSIPFRRYVRIISGVGGGGGVRQRDFIARIFTTSPFVDPASVLEFSNATDVTRFFGAGSEEAARANTYFGYVSPSTSSPLKLAFAKDSSTGNPAMVIGNNDFKSIGSFQSVIAGQFAITVAGVTTSVSGIDLSDATDLADVASEVQTSVRALGGMYAAATVTFGIVRPSAFVLTIMAGTSGTSVSVDSNTSGAGDLAELMGLKVSDGAINITAANTMRPVESLQSSEAISNNFGSFVFQAALQLGDVEELAAYNMSQNVMYQYQIGVSKANAAPFSEALLGYAGTGLTLSPIADQYPEMIPTAILAATDYSKRNAVQNYMYKQFAGISSSVSTEADANLYDGLRVNYYGDTSTAGQRIMFYQRGKLMGTTTAPVDMNVYANEQWLKDYAGSQIMSLQLSVGRVPANLSGKGMIYNILQPVIDQALRNGVISTGKELTPQQKVFISQQTGDDLAWQKIQSAGYVLSVTISSYVQTDSSTEYKASYLLLYSKDDAVRFVDGTHSLV